jgi:hypothetical protein
MTPQNDAASLLTSSPEGSRSSTAGAGNEGSGAPDLPRAGRHHSRSFRAASVSPIGIHVSSEGGRFVMHRGWPSGLGRGTGTSPQALGGSP